MPRKNTAHAFAELTLVGDEVKEVCQISSTEAAAEQKPKRGTVGAMVKEMLLDASVLNLTLATCFL